MPFLLPVLYPILDASILSHDSGQGESAREVFLESLLRELIAAGVTLLQYRNKNGSDEQILADCAVLRPATSRSAAAAKRWTLILNDRPDLVAATGFDGVHVGQHDLSPSEARTVMMAIGVEECIVGVSTHNDAQLRAADATDADYIAIGPVFATTSKENPDPTIGLEGVRRARALTSKPLVAIGGITLANCRSVREAGADSVALISAIFGSGSGANASPRQIEPGVIEKTARDFFRELR